MWRFHEECGCSCAHSVFLVHHHASSLSITTLQAQNRPALEAGELPRVVVLATGGTIATRFDPAVGVDLGLLTGEQIVAAAPGLAELASVDVEQISNVGSRNMTPEIWRRLGSRVNELLSSPDVTGIVVTHGTDTLEETAFFLDLTVTSDKPVVLVGAQRAPTYFDTDGPEICWTPFESPYPRNPSAWARWWF